MIVSTPSTRCRPATAAPQDSSFLTSRAHCAGVLSTRPTVQPSLGLLVTGMPYVPRHQARCG